MYALIIGIYHNVLYTETTQRRPDFKLIQT
jgi:hypothetical protein